MCARLQPRISIFCVVVAFIAAAPLSRGQEGGYEGVISGDDSGKTVPSEADPFIDTYDRALSEPSSRLPWLAGGALLGLVGLAGWWLVRARGIGEHAPVSTPKSSPAKAKAKPQPQPKPNSPPATAIEAGPPTPPPKPEPKPTSPPPTPSVEAPCNVFLSYRRDDQVAAALLVSIYDRLAQRFGSEHVFRDIDSIPLGIDFRGYIASKIEKCDVCVALIGPQWLEILEQRKDDPKDFLRLEIEAALERDIPVIPLLAGNAEVPPEERLPETVRALAWRNGMTLSMGRDFRNQVDRLARELQKLADASRN